MPNDGRGTGPPNYTVKQVPDIIEIRAFDHQLVRPAISAKALKRRKVMTDSDNPLHFSIQNKRLFHDSKDHGFREVTHIKRLDGGGFDYLKLWVSGRDVHAGHSFTNQFFTLTLTPEGQLEGKRPGGYQYAWVLADK